LQPMRRVQIQAARSEAAPQDAPIGTLAKAAA
jgi:hypothetical protein